MMQAEFTVCLSEDSKFPFPFQNHAANGMMEIGPLACAKGPEGDGDCDTLNISILIHISHGILDGE